MSATLLAATGRPRRLVNRVKQLQQVKEAIFPSESDHKCQVVLIKGKGGLGKTRFLEELRRRLGDPKMRDFYGKPTAEEDWSILLPKAIVCQPIELGDVKMIGRQYMLAKLGDPDSWQGKINFDKFDIARRRQQRLIDLGAAATVIATAAEEAEKAFWDDYKVATDLYRLVIPVDTAEYLAKSSSRWLLENELISPDELLFDTSQWLLKKIRENKFKNSILLIAGRDGDDEGDFFFDQLQKAIGQSDCQKTEIHFVSLEFEETVQFFREMETDWHNDSTPNAAGVRDALTFLLNDEKRLQVLHHYTGGQPVRLSLYMDILVEGQTIPPQLSQSLDEARRKTKSDGKKETEELKEARRAIEAQFIQLLFERLGDLRSQILQILVRTPRGLTEEGVLFALTHNPEEAIESWRADEKKLDGLHETLEQMMNLSIIRVKADGYIGLQDEIYRIYADQMAGGEKQKNEERERKALYQQLQDRAKYKYETLSREWATIIRNDLQNIRIGEYSNILNTRLPMPDYVEDEARRKLTTELLDHELEYIHYAFLTDPEAQFNVVFDRITNAEELALSEDRVVVIQAEMWRLLRDPYMTQFVDLQPRPEVKKRGETAWDVLRRVADQDSATKLIMRLTLRGKYKEAIERADRIERIVKAYTGTKAISWNHTFTEGERNGWREYARILAGEEIDKAIEKLKANVGWLETLRKTSRREKAFPNREDKTHEKGFAGYPDDAGQNVDFHPAYPRLLVTIASIHNSLGYAYVTLGDSRQAVQEYTKALQYLRETKDEAQQARVRNNLSRALVDMSKGRAIRICEDALELRIRSGRLYPIALSFNTLGLIFNDLNRPAEAIDACARAFAIAHALEDPRLSMLVLTQLSEGLRRFVVWSKVLEDDKGEAIYREALRAIEQAREIAVSRQELAREIEVNIEMGSLHRDWLLIVDKEKSRNLWDKQYKRALFYLEEAEKKATSTLVRLALDAKVNIAWTHYYADKFSKAEEAIEAAYQFVTDHSPKALFVQASQSLPKPTEVEDHSPGALFVQESQPLSKPRKVEGFFFQQLSKMKNLRGRIAFDRFNELTTEAKQQSEGQEQLKSAASAYVQAVGYVQLYSTHSYAITALYEALYSYLKKLNDAELRKFYSYETKARKEYGTDNIRPENLSDLKGFLEDCFGDYYESEVER